jgi:hypothetical protein
MEETLRVVRLGLIFLGAAETEATGLDDFRTGL